jgi:hypothetical protein
MIVEADTCCAPGIGREPVEAIEAVEHDAGLPVPRRRIAVATYKTHGGFALRG